MTAANTIPPFANPFARLASDEPRFTAMAIMLALLAIPTLAALGLDARSFEGLNPWIKPLKFELSLGLYLITLAFFARFVPVECVTAALTGCSHRRSSSVLPPK